MHARCTPREIRPSIRAQFVQWTIELKAIATRITKMKLSRAPWRVSRYGPRAAVARFRTDRSAFTKFLKDRVDIADHEAECRAIDRIRPLPCISPLNMQLHFIALYANVFRTLQVVLKDNHEPESLVEPYYFTYIASTKNRMHGLKRSTHYTPPEDVVRLCVLM